MEQKNTIGESPWRVDGVAKVTGKAMFPSDISLPHMAHGVTLRSPVASGRLKAIDSDDGAKMPGVLAVLTHRDIPGMKQHGVLTPDMPVFVEERILSVNDPILMVVAETEDIAREAVRKIRVEYEELPGVYDVLEAMEESAPQVKKGGNIGYRLCIEKGDVAEGRKASAAIVEATFTTPMVDQGFLQPEGAVASVDPGGNVALYVATQYPHWDRTEIARCLALPQNKVRVVTTAVGGAFGGREDMSLQCHACLGAMLLRRPVKVTYDRRESFVAHSKRHPLRMEYQAGADRKGRLTFLSARLIGDAGAYLSWSPNVLRKAAVHATGPYRIPHVKVESLAVHTNNPFTGAMRGFGAAQAAVAAESIIDMLAVKLGMHPFTFRYRNGFVTGDETATGQVLAGAVGLRETMEKAAESAGWDWERLR